jgi:hypothetical protein
LDDNVSLGRLIGSNRQYIEEVIPHRGSLLSTTLADVLQDAEVVVIGTRGVATNCAAASDRTIKSSTW